MAVNLTEGAIPMISSGELQATDVKPVLQVMDIRAVQTQTPAGTGGENKERYRVLLSDGVFHQQGMLATQRNELVRSQQLQKGSVVQLTEFVCNTIRERIIIIIIDLNVILDKCDIIGDAKPCPLKLPSNEAPSMTKPPAPMQPSPQLPPPTISNPQPFTGNSPAPTTTRPNFNMAAPVHTHANVFNNNSLNFSIFTNVKTDSFAVNGNNPMHPIRPAYNNQPPPMYGNRGPMAKNEAPPRIIPIAALNPYQGRWTIKARVTAKGELRRYNNAKGDGKVFSFDLLDSDGGEIRATCFNAVADQFYDVIEVGKVYYISKGTLKPAQKAFNHLKNDHEITLDNMSTVQPCFDDDTSIPQQQFHFRSISEIESMDSNSVLDIIGVVSSITPSMSIMRKNGMETYKRSVHLKDMSGKSIELTLWGNFCNAEGQTLQNMCDSGVFPVLAVKSARVYDFNGKSVGTVSTSQLLIEPDFPEAQKLKRWFESVGKNTPSVSISRETISRTDVFKTISQIKDDKLGTSEKPDWITVSATIWHLKVENFCYTACPIMINDRQCSKKVVNNGDGKWRCDKCDKTIDECDYRYILQLQIQDHTGLTWVTAFQESGEEIMGVSAKELYFMKNEEQDEDRFTETVRNVLFTKYNFKLKVKEEIYSDEQRVKSTVVKAEKIKFSSNTKILLQDLQKMDKRDDPSFETPGLNAGHISQFGNVGFKEAAPAHAPAPARGPPAVNYVGQQGVLPASQVGHYGNQYGGLAGNSGASGECYKCHQVGHWARDCPGVSNVPTSYGSESGGPGRLGGGGVATGGGNDGASGECYKCHQVGHWARDCPGTGNVVPSYGGERGGLGRFNGGGVAAGSAGECYKCHQMGHWARDCPGGTNVSQGRYGSASKQYVGGY